MLDDAGFADIAPFLAVGDDFHPKRSQTHQKLSTFLTSRFEDVSNDIHFELAR